MTKVAIVEDNPTVRDYLTELIDGVGGYQCVCVCESAEEAMLRIPASEPHVVLMDINLPGASGIACTAFLHGKMPESQVIILTVFKDIQTIFHALKAGACAYVLKRAGETEILNVIATVRSGRAPMSSDVARMVFRSFQNNSGDGVLMDHLSLREVEILTHVAGGLSHNEIASGLEISIETVRSQLMNIYKKLHAHCRAEAVAKYSCTVPGAAMALS